MELRRWEHVLNTRHVRARSYRGRIRSRSEDRTCADQDSHGSCLPAQQNAMPPIGFALTPPLGCSLQTLSRLAQPLGRSLPTRGLLPPSLGPRATARRSAAHSSNDPTVAGEA
jgi:hypothetical protein